MRVGPHFSRLATGLAYLSLSLSQGKKKDLASPVPGCLAAILLQSMVDSRLAGLTIYHIPYIYTIYICIPLVQLSLASAYKYMCQRSTRLALQLVLVKRFKLYSFQLQSLEGPALLFIVTTSLCQDWVICAPAAFLGCGGHFSGPLSGTEP